ncbi:MAG: glycosyltransferase [Alphaproteobacteria bacterium]|nr:glycosyltransferase [Alphaproteobacteria bacterium]
MSENVKLSVICTTYNHERFIRDCLEGFVMQKTDFPFEILINDDASTDKTADIIREYEAKYPNLFRCVYQTENQWGKKSVWTDILFPMVRGEYVALCEGDDYWTDPLKLQKQVDFLDAHSDFSVCFHPVTVHWDDNSKPDSVFPNDKEHFYKTELTLNDLLDHNFIQTNSVVYRWRFHKDPLDLIPNGILPGDWFLHLLHAQVGKIAFLPDVMAVYRRNQIGLWYGAGESPKWFIQCGTAMVRFYSEIQKHFGKDCKDDLDKISLITYLYLQKTNDKERIKELLSVCSPPLDYLQHSFLKYLFYAVFSRLCFGKLRKRMRSRRKLLKKIVKLN